MGKVKIIKVCNRKEMDDFIRIPKAIYKDCPQYVPDLESSIRELFDVRCNPGLEFSDIQPFVAYRDGEPAGRIVGIVNHKANERWGTQNVRFSMIEFIDDREVSAALLTAVEQWGRESGMTAIHGPLGITDFDKEGMLVEDFDMLGSMNMSYNLEYYPRHLESLGYEKEVDWVQIHIDIPQEVPAKYARVAQYVREQLGLRVVKLTDREIFEQGYGKKAFDLLNIAFKPIFGYSALSDKQISIFLDKYLKMIDKQLIPVILNEQDEVVGMAVTMASLSKAMQKAKGRLLPFGWYHLLKALKWKPEDNAEMLLIGVHPDLQGLGVNTLFFEDLIPIYNRYGFKWAETGPQLEYNSHELTQWKPLNPRFVKRRRCFKRSLS